jgi:hypothetical protein
LRGQSTEQRQRHARVTIGEIDRYGALDEDMVARLEVDAVAGTVGRPLCPCFQRLELHLPL